MGISRPAPKAAARKVLFTRGRAGRPKLTFDTPSTVRTPRRSFTRATARRISRTSSWLVAAAMTRQSMATSSRGMP